MLSFFRILLLNLVQKSYHHSLFHHSLSVEAVPLFGSDPARFGLQSRLPFPSGALRSSVAALGLTRRASVISRGSRSRLVRFGLQLRLPFPSGALRSSVAAPVPARPCPVMRSPRTAAAGYYYCLSPFCRNMSIESADSSKMFSAISVSSVAMTASILRNVSPRESIRLKTSRLLPRLSIRLSWFS